jgi:YesN/AraC family two-component response regulator
MRAEGAVTAVSPAKSDAAAILVVDDDEVMRDLLTRMLQRSGFVVITAANGHEGIERFAESPVQLTITDIKMPRVDGLELIQALLAKKPDVAIVAMSGVDEWDQYCKRARALGAKAALRKPVGRAELIDTIAKLLAESKR